MREKGQRNAKRRNGDFVQAGSFPDRVGCTHRARYKSWQAWERTEGLVLAPDGIRSPSPQGEGKGEGKGIARLLGGNTMSRVLIERL